MQHFGELCEGQVRGLLPGKRDMWTHMLEITLPVGKSRGHFEGWLSVSHSHWHCACQI